MIENYDKRKDRKTIFWTIWNNLPIRVRVIKEGVVEGQKVYLVESLTGGVFQVDEDMIWREAVLAVEACEDAAQMAVEKILTA